MGLEIQEVDSRVAPAGLLREMHRYYIGLDAESLPDDPPKPEAQRLAGWRHIPDHEMIPRWVLRQDGEIVAVAVVFMDVHDDLDNGFACIHVRPDMRRRGYATLLATALFDRLESEGRKSLITDVPDGAEWEVKLEALGLKKSFQEKRSRLITSELDRGLMDSWIARASERASGYHLLYLETPIPQQHLEPWCEVQQVMHTAPKEDLEFEYVTWTPDKWRDHESSLLTAGDKLVGYVAVHDESGEFVGLSNIVIQGHQPDMAWQADTGVHPGHRNQGLGRWLKAATIKTVLEEHPEIERIDTYNAGSNEAMLKINLEMGYRPILMSNAWQGDLAVVRERLGA